MTLKLLIGFEGTNASRHALAYIAPLTADPTVETSVVVAARSRPEIDKLIGEAETTLGITAVPALPHVGSLYDGLMQTARAGNYDMAVFGEMQTSWLPWARWRQRPSLTAALPISSLLVRGVAKGITRALICAGGDETVIADARLTARLVRRTGAKATILHVLSQMPLMYGSGRTRDRITEAFAATGAPEMQYMQLAADELKANQTETTIKVRVGLVVEEIVDELVTGAYDLLVIGAHRSQGLVERLLLEDVTADILGHSPVPVLVVKTTFNAA